MLFNLFGSKEEDKEPYIFKDSVYMGVRSKNECLRPIGKRATGYIVHRMV